MIIKILKWIGIILLSLILISFFLPSKSHVERTAILKAPTAVIHKSIADLHQWPNWSPWIRMDTNIVLEYQNNLVGKGASYSWKSKIVGNGKLEIIEDSPEFIKAKMDFDGMGISFGTYTLKNEGEGTKVTWSMDSEGEGMPFYFKPISKYFNLMMDKMIGPDFEKGLQTLDEYSLQMAKLSSGSVLSVEEMTSKNMILAQMIGTCSPNEIGAKLGEMYGAINEKITPEQIKVVGMPLASYPEFDPTAKLVRVLAMLPVDKKCKSLKESEVYCFEIIGQKLIKAVFQGPYENSKMAYDAIEAYIKEKGYETNGQPYEEYANDPMEVKDPNLYLTNVYWPYK